MMQAPELELWRKELDDAVAPNGQVLVDLIPEISMVFSYLHFNLNS